MFSRRDLLKGGLFTGGAALATSRRAQAQLCIPESFPTPKSPALKPFVQPLPIMPIAQPVDHLNPAPVPGNHQRYAEFLPKFLYDMPVKDFMHKFHPDLPPNPVWGYDGMIPGPTIHARYGEPALMRIRNLLPPNYVGVGLPKLSTHLHNGNTASESDGYPMDLVEPGTYRDHHYGNAPAGGDPREIMNTLWYHDHCNDFTAQNVAKGLSAFYLLFDTLDSGDENDPNPAAFRLPSGQYDIPMVLHDRAFDNNGVQLYNVFNTLGVLGDKYTINNAIQPFFQVARRKYRLRFLNGGPSRFYQLALSNGQLFVQVTNDGNMLPEPIAVKTVTLSVAERVDVIVDFSNAKVGDQIYLVNLMEQTDGAGPSGRTLNPPDQMMRFDVVSNDTRDPSQIPDRLRELPPIDLTQVKNERLWKFDYLNGTWLVNGQLFDHGRSDAEIGEGSAEIWTFRNEGTQWSHPIHIHFEEYQILSINGVKPRRGSVDLARKDTVFLGPNDEITIFMRFRGFVGKYVMHCHNVVHEDHTMMIRYDVVPTLKRRGRP
ncbi:MAG TPA: multicopper oxidase domain-containing protein [Acidobacteriota bacterium]|jgi:FtsP/CotA-like multicopper oxidase with cupredoxin domain|nr:multicopper oxidase domain-containing protein [Acidobacteriota bacterium]